MSAQDCKIGNFDWITEYDEIELYLQSDYTGLSNKKDDLRVLVAGCGTSKLSLQLADSGFGEIISVDNDSQVCMISRNFFLFDDFNHSFLSHTTYSFLNTYLFLHP
jgi:ribosomal protein L11 methylase PrmA